MARKINSAPSSKEKIFCTLMAEGRTQTEAVMRAGWNIKSAASACAYGNKILKRPRVQKYLEEIRQEILSHQTMHIAEYARRNAEIVRTPIGQIDENHWLAEGVKRDRETGEVIEIRMPSKSAAMDREAKRLRVFSDVEVKATLSLEVLDMKLAEKALEAQLIEPEQLTET